MKRKTALHSALDTYRIRLNRQKIADQSENNQKQLFQPYRSINLFRFFL